MKNGLLTTILGGALALAVGGFFAIDLFADKGSDASKVESSTDSSDEKTKDQKTGDRGTGNPTEKPEPSSVKDKQPNDKGVDVALASRSESASKLPVTKVVLFNSGVGYFQRNGEVEGDVRIDLSFPVQDINDMLKSMVVQDLSGGQVSAVGFDSQSPIEKTLRSFAIDLSKNPTFGQILDQARGEKVEVVLQQSNTQQPGTITGSIIGIEKQRLPVGKEGIVEVEQINLWCAEGIRSVKLTDILRVRFLNPVMESEFRKALEVVTMSHDTQKKAVTLNFTGNGKRNVRVGYVVENPIWKTSYRLVLDKEKAPFLQGWAVVENNTDEDWNHVQMTLVSGRPISFQMDLYQPLYVPRPLVEPELFASLRPPTYSGAIRKEMEKLEKQAANGAEAGDRLREQLQRKSDGKDYDKQLKGAADAWGKLPEKERSLNLQQGVQQAATAQNLGDYFAYDVDHRISLGRQKSAMLPIVNKGIEGTRVSIYNERVHSKFPLLGLKFKNTTGYHLTQGPITVFEGNNYAGDARILDLQPKEERLISYAVDLGTEVMPVASNDNGRRTSVKIVKGVIHSTIKAKETKTYTVKNRSEQDRLVLIEHPFRSQFKLTSTEKPMETASDVYRFQVKVPKGEEAVKFVVSEEQDIREDIQLLNSDDNRIQIVLNDVVATPKIKEAIKEAQKLKWELAKTLEEVKINQREIDRVKNEQPRLRDNLAKIPLTDPLAKRILEKLNSQETEIEKYEAEIKKHNATADQQRKSYENYLVNLNVE